MDVLANGQKALYIFDGLYIAMDGYEGNLETFNGRDCESNFGAIGN